MRPSRRRVTAVALLMFGLALAPLGARPVHRPRHVATAASPISAPISVAWNKLLSLVGLKAGDEAGNGGDAQGGLTQPIPPPVIGDIRAGLDPNG
jgi:hypothetical protein